MIFVFGVARSGTSAVARVLEQRFGVDMGGPGLMRPANPDGIYERDRLAKADKALSQGDIGILQWVKEVRAEFDDLAEPWGYKHPMNAHVIMSYLALYPTATVVLVQRDMDATAGSWARTYGMGADSALRAVRQTKGAIDTALKHVPRLEVDMTTPKTDDEIVAMLNGYRGLCA